MNHDIDKVECTWCNKKLSKLSLDGHIKRVHEKKEYKCEICQSTFKSQKILKNHELDIHIKDKVYKQKCDICDKEFEDKAKYYRHKDRHIEKKEYCSICRKSVYHLNEHEKRAHYLKGAKLSCELCGKQFSSEKGLDKHLGNVHGHSDRKKYVCDICNQHFSTSSSRGGHIKRTHGEHTFKCHICEVVSKSEKELSKHLKTHNKIIQDERKLEKCDICEKYFLLLKNHMEIVHSQSKCDICGTSYPKIKLNQHMKNVHTAPKKYECHICKKHFTTKYMTNIHRKRMHCTSSLKCDICDTICKTNSELKIHLKTHSKNIQAERELRQCDMCNKKYLKIKEHIATMHPKEISECNICGKSYPKNKLDHHKEITHCSNECPRCHKIIKGKHYLRIHIKRVHDKIKAHKCDICNKALGNSIALKNHKSVIHTKEINFNCSQCFRSFGFKANLLRHQKTVHLQEQRKCNLCGKSVISSYLKSHTEKHHLGIKYKCKQCEKTFTSRGALLYHTRFVHNKKNTCMCVGIAIKHLSHFPY